MTKPRPVHLEDLPRYATDAQLGAYLLGPARAREWENLALVLERKGLPPIDALHKGRYVPAVLRWYDLRHGLLDKSAPPERRPEREVPWKDTFKRRV